MVQNRVGLMWSREEVSRTGCVPHFQQVHGKQGQVQHSGRSCSFCPAGLRQAEADHAGGFGLLVAHWRNVSANFVPQQSHAVLPAGACPTLPPPPPACPTPAQDIYKTSKEAADEYGVSLASGGCLA